MILKIFEDECSTCHQSNPNPVRQIRVAFSSPQIEFDKDGHRYVIFMVDDTPDSIQVYQKLIAEGKIDYKR